MHKLILKNYHFGSADHSLQFASMIAALGEFLYRSRIEARKGQISSMVCGVFWGYLVVNMMSDFKKNFRESLCDQLKVGKIYLFLRKSPMFFVFKLSMQGSAVVKDGNMHEMMQKHKAGKKMNLEKRP